MVDAEKFLGLYHEYSIQQAFLHADWFMAFWNIYYGTIHFVMPVVALVWLYRKAPARYVRWRNTMVLMLAISVITFWCYPLMPPRLMPARFGFVDAAAHYFNFGPQVRVHLTANGQPSAAAVRAYGNLFAAMPSLHVGWSTWTVLAIWPLLRRTWAKRAVRALPGHHLLLHRRHRQPLDPRRGRRLGGARARIPRRARHRAAAGASAAATRAR